MAQLCQHRDALDTLNVEVLLIAFHVPPFADRWLQETGNCFPLLIDPERTTYGAYGLERSVARSWNVKTVLRYVELMRAGRNWRGIQGDSVQLGGDFVVNTDGVVRLAYRSHDPTDRPSVGQLLDVLEQLS